MLARDKHSSLFIKSIEDEEENKMYDRFHKQFKLVTYSSNKISGTVVHYMHGDIQFLQTH
jgi:hypothetical protein